MAALSQLNTESKQEGGNPALRGAVGPASSSTAGGSPAEAVPKKKICCACPDTKRLRDNCVAEHGPDACSKWIDAHLQCLRSEGFKV